MTQPYVIDEMISAKSIAARIEALSKDLGVTLVVSEAFVGPWRERFRSLGEHELRNIGGRHELFTYTGADV